MLDVLASIDKNKLQTLDSLFSFLRMRSISADPAYATEVRTCAEWLSKVFKETGFSSRVDPTRGHPVVVAEWKAAPEKPTILIYGHYDVQPAAPIEKWSTDPFEPEIKGENIVARGASDDKGQLFCHVAAARAHMDAKGRLPLNIVFLIEGEEESGSENFEGYLRSRKDEFACDAIIVSDSPQYAPGIPALTYGLRGLSYFEITLRGPGKDLHSGMYGGAVMNPANALARIIAELHDSDGKVTIPGFYDCVAPIEDWERNAFAGLPFSEKDFREKLGVESLWGEAGYTPLERMWARPTLDVNGIWSGYTGEGAKTVLPAEASAKFSCRLVPNQNPDKIGDLVENYLKKACPAGCSISIKRYYAGRPVLTDVNSAAARAARKAVALGFGTDPVFIREGGSIPIVETFQSLLKAPVVLLGFGRPDDGAHGPNEKLNIEDFWKGVQTSAHLMELAAKLSD